MKLTNLRTWPLLAAFVSCALFAMRSQASLEDKHPVEPYVPGLGDLMSGIQSHHAKMWFAGEAANWPLAQYELDEVLEGIDDASKLHATFKDNPMPLATTIPLLLDPAKKGLAKSIETKTKAGFELAFDALTAGCNACHQTYKHEFIRIVRPTAVPMTNQAFDPK